MGESNVEIQSGECTRGTQDWGGLYKGPEGSFRISRGRGTVLWEPACRREYHVAPAAVGRARESKHILLSGPPWRLPAPLASRELPECCNLIPVPHHKFPRIKEKDKNIMITTVRSKIITIPSAGKKRKNERLSLTSR